MPRHAPLTNPRLDEPAKPQTDALVLDFDEKESPKEIECVAQTTLDAVPGIKTTTTLFNLVAQHHHWTVDQHGIDIGGGRPLTVDRTHEILFTVLVWRAGVFGGRCHRWKVEHEVRNRWEEPRGALAKMRAAAFVPELARQDGGARTVKQAQPVVLERQPLLSSSRARRFYRAWH
jgi:hypothetical protein